MKIETLTLGELATNCYLLWEETSGEALIIDPADSGETIVSRVLELQLIPTAIVLTHGHFDHVLGLLEVKLALDLPVYLHPGDNELLSQAGASARHWLKRAVDPVPAATHTLTEGHQLSLGGVSFEVLETPGHTPGSICLYSVAEKIIFTGDTLFKEGVGRTDFSYSSPLALEKSLQRLANDCRGYSALPGHGDRFLVQEG